MAHSDYLVDLRDIRDRRALVLPLDQGLLLCGRLWRGGFGVRHYCGCVARAERSNCRSGVPAEFKDSLPEDYVRRSLDDTSDVRLFQSLPEVKAMAYATARVGWNTGITLEMRKASYDLVDFYEFIWLRLAEFYPPKHFGRDGANEYVRQYVRDRYKFHWAKHEPNGVGAGGTIVGVLTGGDVLNDLDRLMVETATAIVGYRDDFDFDSWLKRWNDLSSSPD